MVCNIFVLIRLLVARSYCRDSCACMHRSCSGCNTTRKIFTDFCTSQSVDLGSFPKSSHTKILLKMVLTVSALGAQHKQGIVSRTSRQACLLCPWARHLTGRLHLYVANRWPTRTSPGYNCQVANPACCKRRLLGTHQWHLFL